MKNILYKLLIASVLFLSLFSCSTKSVSYYDIVVAQDGSGDYIKLQEAINSVADSSNTRTVIYIKNGKYDTEKLIIPESKINITLVGESKEHTILSYHIYDCKSPDSGNKCPEESYNQWKDNADLIRTSATLTVKADGFIAENLTIENTAGAVGQALALTVTADKGIYRNCNLLGYQDTVYLWTAGKRTYFERCLILGRTDYIYGGGIGYFESCEIRSWGGGWITAPSTGADQQYGFVFNNCQITYAENSPREGDDGKTFSLGRPWHNYPKVAWLHCEFSDMLNPLGWSTKWNMPYSDSSDSLHLYEYKNIGSRANIEERANWKGIKEMTSTESLNYTLERVMGGWNPKL